MFLHTWRCQVPLNPSSCAPFMLNYHWGRAATGKKSHAYAHRVASVISNPLWPCRLWPARLLCQGGGFSRQEYWSMLANTGCHTLLELYFLLPWPPPPRSPWCCQNPCDPSSCTTSTPGPQRGKPKSSKAASRANLRRLPISRGGNKITVETRGSVTKEEDPKPSHQLYKLQIKSTQSTRQTLCLWNI